jgi:hypothetical protein
LIFRTLDDRKRLGIQRQFLVAHHSTDRLIKQFVGRGKPPRIYLFLNKSLRFRTKFDLHAFIFAKVLPWSKKNLKKNRGKR